MNRTCIGLLIAAVLAGCGTAPDQPIVTSHTAAVAQDQSKQLGDDFHANFGETSWGMTVADVRVADGNAHFRAQIDRSDTATAEQIQRGARNMIRFSDSYPGVAWVIVEDGAGTVITQSPVR